MTGILPYLPGKCLKLGFFNAAFRYISDRGQDSASQVPRRSLDRSHLDHLQTSENGGAVYVVIVIEPITGRISS